MNISFARIFSFFISLTSAPIRLSAIADMTSVIPNSPTRAGTTFIPPCKLLIPRVRRGRPITLSMPIIATNKPNAALTSPFVNDLLVRLPTAKRPKNERRK